MILQLLSTSDPRNKVEKTTTQIASLSGALKDGSSITDPVILVESADLPAANYAFIEVFQNRYYFIKDIRNVNNNLWEISMHVDVLMSYSSAILSSPCIVAKTASDRFNLYLPDPNFKCQQNDRYGMVSFPSGFDASNAYFYLTLFG